MRSRPEHTALYRLVREHYETFAAEVAGPSTSSGQALPQFVKDEFDAYLDCGILAKGFLRLRCDTCACDTLVAFMAKGVGATHVVNTSRDDPVKTIRAMTRGLGVDHAFEAVGVSKLCRQAIESLAVRGTATIVGVLPPDAMIEFPWLAIRPECKVQTSRMGSNQFRTDIPNYLEFYRQGRLDLDGMISRRGRLEDINDAFRAMKAGEVARTVLMFD